MEDFFGTLKTECLYRTHFTTRAEVEQYEKEIPNYDNRFVVRAGLTALSHVYGRYSTDIVDRTRYDLLYVQNYSLMMDIRVMLLTSRTIFMSDAADGVRIVDHREAAK